MTDANLPPKKPGCLFYGCTGLVVVALLAGILGWLAYRKVTGVIKNLVAEYTETSPSQLERIQFTPGQKADLEKRLAAFQEAMNKQQTTQDLVLNSTDLNMIVSREKDLRDRVTVSIDEDRIRGQISIPLPDLGPIKMSGRYLNGNATIGASMANGILVVHLEEVQVKGRPLPPKMMSEVRKINFAEKATEDARNAEQLQKIESITVTNGTVILRNRVR